MANIFDNVLVVDMTNNAAGPTVTAMLSDYGATVVKIERPVYGDDMRGYAPFIEGKSLPAIWHNRGKKSIVLDTKKSESISIIKDLIKMADVFVESFRPGVIDKMGLGYEEIIKIKPDIIMCSISTFGQNGPYSKNPGYDLIAQALSGMMSVTGPVEGPPYKLGVAMGDYLGGFNAFGAISAALYHRQKAGEGQYIDIALVDGLVAANENCEPAFNGLPVQRTGNHHSMVSPFGLFQGSNGSIIIAAINENLWSKLCSLMGREDLVENPDYNSTGKRAKIYYNIVEIVESWLKTFDDINSAQKILTEKGIPCAKVQNLHDLINDPQILSREMVAEVETKEISQGKIKGRGLHLKFSKTPGKLKPSPALGEHSIEVLSSILGYSKQKIEELQNVGIFEG